jgi:hypothetical protein
MSGFGKISEAFESSHRRLISADQNEDVRFITDSSNRMMICFKAFCMCVLFCVFACL